MRRFSLLLLLVVPSALDAADHPEPTSGDCILHDFRFASGEQLPELRVHYRTLGSPQQDQGGGVRNAVLILHGTTGSGANFLRPEFAGELFGKGQPLDASRYFLILPDGIGHGASSKPSDGLRARFPRYGYRDMIEAQYRLVTEGLKIDHLRLVIGTSMGGMHTWLWGQKYPDFMDALLPLASLPSQISGRNRVWRRVIIDAIRNDPGWEHGDYRDQPPSLRTAAEMLFLMSNNPVERQKEAPTREGADRILDDYIARTVRTSDANDVLYAVESSADYDPGSGLGRIAAPLVAINFEDDLINPPELGVLERETRRVQRGKAVLIPWSERTRGHGTHTLAAVWKDHLVRLLADTEPASRDEPGVTVLFQEQFGSALGTGWTWVREEPKAWRIEDRALVLRTLPGYLHARMNNSKNLLLRSLPDPKRSSMAVEVKVESDPQAQYEHAGLVWYYDDDNYVALFKERLDGKPELQMVTEKDGKPSFAVKPCESKTVWLRLVASGTNLVSQYRSSTEGAWQTVGESTLPVRGEPRVGISSGGAPENAERDARFRCFRILELTK
jgi:homoserine O-acetyltransferase